MNYVCPVCGFSELPEKPENYSICPCCGTEFGFDDAEFSYAELRARWIAEGMHWFSRYRLKPANWSPWEQLVTYFPDAVPYWIRQERKSDNSVVFPYPAAAA